MYTSKLTCCNITSDTHTEYILTLISTSVLAYTYTQYSSVSMLTGYITIFLHGKSLLFFSYHSSRLVLNESSSSLVKLCSWQWSILPRGIFTEVNGNILKFVQKCNEFKSFYYSVYYTYYFSMASLCSNCSRRNSSLKQNTLL